MIVRWCSGSVKSQKYSELDIDGRVTCSQLLCKFNLATVHMFYIEKVRVTSGCVMWPGGWRLTRWANADPQDTNSTVTASQSLRLSHNVNSLASSLQTAFKCQMTGLGIMILSALSKFASNLSLVTYFIDSICAIHWNQTWDKNSIINLTKQILS